MTLDVEHFMKVALIKAVEDRMDTVGDEDGYKIIEGYLLADDIQSISKKSQTMAKRNRQFFQKIDQNKNNPSRTFENLYFLRSSPSSSLFALTILAQ